VKAAVGEYRQPKCDTVSNPQPVKTLQQWADVPDMVATTGSNRSIAFISRAAAY